MVHVKFPSAFKGAFNNKLELHRADLYRVAWSWCHDTVLAEDLVQETYAKALKNRSQLKEISKLKPWLMRILANLHVDYLRSKQLTEPYEDVHQITENNPDSIASRDESVQIVRDAIAQLNDTHRKIITLVDITEFTYAEVAEILEIPVGTVMSRLSRARDHLKKILNDIDNPKEKLSSSPNILRRVK
jgi:RNA polymerase sigma-70 factor (ECF subfamily)